MIFCRERDNSRAVDNGESIAKNNYGVGVLGGGRGKGGVEFICRGRLNHRQSHAQIPEFGQLLSYIRV